MHWVDALIVRRTTIQQCFPSQRTAEGVPTLALGTVDSLICYYKLEVNCTVRIMSINLSAPGPWAQVQCRTV